MPVVSSSEHLYDGGVYLFRTGIWTIEAFDLIPTCLANNDMLDFGQSAAHLLRGSS